MIEPAGGTARDTYLLHKSTQFSITKTNIQNEVLEKFRAALCECENICSTAKTAYLIIHQVESIFTHHQFGETRMQLLSRRHGRTELQQLQWHGVLQVDLRGLAAAEAAQEAQALSCPLPGGHDGCGNTGGSGGAGPGR